MPYQVFGSSSGAVAVTVMCTRSASARSSGAISAILSRTACRPSAFLAPFFPSARSSAARSFIAARSSALKPSDSVVAVLAGLFGLRSNLGPARENRPRLRSPGSHVEVEAVTDHRRAVTGRPPLGEQLRLGERAPHRGGRGARLPLAPAGVFAHWLSLSRRRAACG